MVEVTNKLYQTIKLNVNGTVKKLPAKTALTFNLKEPTDQMKDMASGKNKIISYKIVN